MVVGLFMSKIILPPCIPSGSTNKVFFSQISGLDLSCFLVPLYQPFNRFAVRSYTGSASCFLQTASFLSQPLPCWRCPSVWTADVLLPFSSQKFSSIPCHSHIMTGGHIGPPLRSHFYSPVVYKHKAIKNPGSALPLAIRFPDRYYVFLNA
jgi:hypothetical protein